MSTDLAAVTNARLISDRGRKWINMQPALGSDTLVSTPMTKYTAVSAQNLPLKAIQNLKRAINRLFPDLTVSLTSHTTSDRTGYRDHGYAYVLVHRLDRRLLRHRLRAGTWQLALCSFRWIWPWLCTYPASSMSRLTGRNSYPCWASTSKTRWRGRRISLRRYGDGVPDRASV